MAIHLLPPATEIDPAYWSRMRRPGSESEADQPGGVELHRVVQQRQSVGTVRNFGIRLRCAGPARWPPLTSVGDALIDHGARNGNMSATIRN